MRPDQLCQDHCRNVARYCERAMRPAHFPAMGYLAGLIHDAGKFKAEFKNYLGDIAAGKPRARGSVNHTYCAPRYILEAYHVVPDSEKTYYSALASELIAFAAGAHHGLFDCVGQNGDSGFDHRREKLGIHYEESIKNFLGQCANGNELDELFRRATDELREFVSSIKRVLPGSNEKNSVESAFYIGLLARLLLSSVIDADRRDTVEYFRGKRLFRYDEGISEVWSECVEFAAAKHAELRAVAANTPLNAAREEIYLQCCSFAERRSGVYRLNVPTGGGKTLSVLSYALRHAEHFNKRRIVFTFPLLSILDQNVKEIRRNIPDGKGYVLEHHSNVVQDDAAQGDMSDNRLNMHELLAETWDAPIIVTTLVQLLNTLFSGKSSCVRRFQALCDSVIVIDEVQTVPLKMVSLFNLAINFLSNICGATVILCSATQPCLEETNHPLAVDPASMVTLSDRQKRAFKRTELTYRGEMCFASIADYAFQVFGEVQSLLIVCNKKDQARQLFESISGLAQCAFHLSAGMCQAHREDVMKGMKAALLGARLGGPTVLCVATQVIEAGVDLSFERVIRFTAGLDSIIQAAGRQNREGEAAEPSEMDIISCSDESLSRLKEIDHAKMATENVIYEYLKNPQAFQRDLASDAAVETFYHELFNRDVSRNSLDYPVDLPDYKSSLLSLLSINEVFCESGCQKYVLNQAFKTAGALFKVFDDDTVDVIVPYGEEGERLISEFGSEGVEYDFGRQKKLLSEARRFSVSLRQYQAEALASSGAIVPVCNGLVLVLQPDNYDQCGIVSEPTGMRFLGV